jgi:hypothetical protein
MFGNEDSDCFGSSTFSSLVGLSINVDGILLDIWEFLGYDEFHRKNKDFMERSRAKAGVQKAEILLEMGLKRPVSDAQPLLILRFQPQPPAVTPFWPQPRDFHLESRRR